MLNALFHAGISNACFALPVAAIAFLLGKNRPHLSHMLWLLVLVKLVTPPIIPIQIVSYSTPASGFVVADQQVHPNPMSSVDIGRTAPLQAKQARLAAWPTQFRAAWNRARPWVFSVWLLGSLAVFAWSLNKVRRFNSLLKKYCGKATEALASETMLLSDRLGIQNLPEVCTIRARISPMVWWAGGQVRVILPTHLLDTMPREQWRWVLAHELAHVRRRDHMVRWLEWLACILFWWNPLAWWAQKNLRAMEEICCDAFVVSRLKPKRRTYAQSLLTAVENIACPAISPPAMASEINSGGLMERRFRMIMTNRSDRVHRWQKACVWLAAIALLPCGLAYAQDYEGITKRLKAAVEAKEITGEQAQIMLGALKSSSNPEKESTKEQYARVEKRIRAAVQDGSMSKEDARTRLQEMRKAMAEQAAPEARIKNQIEQAEKKLEQAVRNGRITKEDARIRLEGMRKTMSDKIENATPAEKRIELARKKIEQAVVTGRISKEDARTRLQEMRKAMAEQTTPEARARKRMEQAEKELEKAVLAGKISKEDAMNRLSDLKKLLAERMTNEEELIEIRRRMSDAVESGELSREEAAKKFEALKNRIETRDPEGTDRPNWDAIERRIEAAVKSGRISREEADAEYRAIKERIAAERK